MKPHFVAILVMISTSVFAQNKTLGVGTVTPNSNAALHVESPTNNQGFIMPRLSTVQRNAISLATPDAGLMVYDNTLSKLFLWDGGSWQPSSGLSFPFSASDGSALSTFSLTNTSTGKAASFAINNAASTSEAVTINTNGNGFGLHVLSTANSGSSISGQVLNPVSGGAAFTGSTNGTGPVLYMRHLGTTSGNILDFDYQDPNNAGTAIVGNHSGLGKVADFNITNNGSFEHVLQATTIGQGTPGFFRVNNAISIAPAVRGTTNGTGGAAYFDITNATSNAPALLASTNGTGRGLMATSSGTGNAATFSITNGGSTTPVVQILNSGSGPALAAVGNIEATGFVGDGSQLTNLPFSETGWSLSGNTGTTAGTDFIGTSDANEVVFKSNNVEAMRIYTSGQIGIGGVPAAAQLAVESSVNALGVYGSIQTVSGGQNKGVWGNASGSTTQNFGVYGSADLSGSNGAIGVYGEGVGTGSADAFGLYGVTNTFTATTGTTYGLYASAINGSTNWAGYFNDGNVHITHGLSVGTPGSYGTNGQILTSQGAGVAPQWQAAPGLSLPYVASDPSAGTSFSLTNSSTGKAASFSITNPGSTSPVVEILNAGTGNAMTAAGTIAANNFTATNSSGADAVGSFTILNPSNMSHAVQIATVGPGRVLDIYGGDAASTEPALNILADGQGPGIWVGSSTTTAAIDVVAGNGRGLRVNVSADPNTAAVEVIKSNGGIGIDLVGGTLKYSVFPVGTAGTIVTRAGIYEITVTGTFNLPTTSSNGETCLVYNGFAGSITVEGQTIAAGAVRQFIRVANAWRIVS